MHKYMNLYIFLHIYALVSVYVNLYVYRIGLLYCLQDMNSAYYRTFSLWIHLIVNPMHPRGQMSIVNTIPILSIVSSVALYICVCIYMPSLYVFFNI